MGISDPENNEDDEVVEITQDPTKKDAMAEDTSFGSFPRRRVLENPEVDSSVEKTKPKPTPTPDLEASSTCPPLQGQINPEHKIGGEQGKGSVWEEAWEVEYGSCATWGLVWTIIQKQI